MAEPLYDSLEIRETVDGATFTAGDTKTSGNAASKSPKPMAKVRRPDPYLWGIYLMLLVISVVELFSASSTEIVGEDVYGPLTRHCIFLVMGLVIVLWLQRTPYVIICRLSWVFAALSLGLVLLSSFMGVEINGAQRAISLGGGMTIQPAEIVKLSVVCLLAYILGRNQRPGGVSNQGVITAAIVVVVFGACLFRNGLTNMILLMGVSVTMMIIGGIPIRKMVYVLMAYAIGAGAVYLVKSASPAGSSEFEKVKQEQFLASAGTHAAASVNIGAARKASENIDRTETRLKRMKNFFHGVHPDDPITDDNRQVMLAKFAQANGGVIGQGPGNSRESARLPLAFSDYIYSIIVEDTGFVGGVLVLVLFLLMLARAGRIAFKCSRALPAFLILGCAVMIVFQALVHMAIVTGLFPVSGQPLPFISKGGTSVLVMSAALGLMLSVSRFASFTSDGKAIKAELNALPEDMQASNFSAAEK